MLHSVKTWYKLKLHFTKLSKENSIVIVYNLFPVYSYLVQIRLL